MDLTPRELDKLKLFTAALVAERRRARGVKLNHPEAIALISASIIEGARDGRSVSELMSAGTQVLREDEVMDGVADLIPEIQVEATFPDGTKLVTVHQPIVSSGGTDRLVPGALKTADGDIELNADRPTMKVLVTNTGDRPVQIGSHYHFFEVNDALHFDRDATRGFRLDIPAGTAIRFEPGHAREVPLVAYAGARQVHGFAGRVMGALDAPDALDASDAAPSGGPRP